LAMSKGATLDLDRVEILKGPQGTLYGQNATGGAVNYIAAKPTDSFAAGIEGTYQDYNGSTIRGYVSGPLTDTLKARLAIETTLGGAWQKSIDDGDHLGNKDLTKGRLLVDWRPTDKLTVAANVNGFYDGSDTLATQATGITPQKATSYPNTPIADPTLRGRTLVSIVGLSPLPFPTNDTEAEWFHGVDPHNDETYGQASLRADYAFSSAATLTYLGSYENYSQNDISTTSGRPQASYYEQRGTIEANSQEVRLGGDLLGSMLNYVVGADFSSAVTHENDLLYYSGITTAYSTVTLPYLARISPDYQAPTTGNNILSRDQEQTDALFGNVEYYISDNVDVHVGGRLTQDNQRYQGCAADDGDGNSAAAFTAIQILYKLKPVEVVAPGGCATLGPTGHPGLFKTYLDQNNFSWRVGVDYRPIPGTLLYAGVSKGYKAGAFPTLAASSYVQLEPVTQESVLAYELGSKSRLLDNHIELDGAIFYYDYRDKQFQSNEPDPLGIFGIVNTLVNIPKSSEVGLELAAKFRPVEDLTLSAQATYLDSRVEGDFYGYNQFTTKPFNFNGQSFPNAPKWALGLGGKYDFDINQKYRGYFGANGRYQTQSQGAFGTDESIALGYPSLEIKAYGLLDLRAGMESRDGRYYLQVFGQNVTNTYYWTQSARVFDGTVRYPGLPATFGVTAGYKF
jgi:iron complex outermembrane recepter protein